MLKVYNYPLIKSPIYRSIILKKYLNSYFIGAKANIKKSFFFLTKYNNNNNYYLSFLIIFLNKI